MTKNYIKISKIKTKITETEMLSYSLVSNNSKLPNLVLLFWFLVQLTEQLRKPQKTYGQVHPLSNLERLQQSDFSNLQ